MAKSSSPTRSGTAAASKTGAGRRSPVEAEVESRVNQQAAVADLGLHALAGVGVPALMDEAVVVLSQMLGVEYSKVLEFLPDGRALLLRAGVGWKKGLVGRATVSAERGSQGGYTLLVDEPVIVEELRAETRFTGPPLLVDHKVVSGLSVVIKGIERPFGVLGAHPTRKRTFSDRDVQFLQAVANVLGEAIERKRAEEALRDSEERYRKIFEEGPLGMAIVGLDYRMVDVNMKLCEMLGYTREELTALTFPDVTHLDDADTDVQLAQKVFLREIPCYTVEKRYIKKDRGIIWAELTASVVHDLAGQPLYGLGMVEDITERKRLEQELQQARENLEGKVEREMLRKNPYGLTFRELTVLHLVAAGRADKEIARELVISPLTVHKHVANILAKMNAASRTEAGVRALREGLLD